jgi:putative heme-binding domain-containing protein
MKVDNRCVWLCCLLWLVSVVIAQEPMISKDDAEKSPLDPPEEELNLNVESLFVDREKEQSIVKRLYAATEDCAAAKAALVEMNGNATELELRALRNLDRELAPSTQPEHHELISLALPIMATSRDETTLQYLHKIFDSNPERRAEVAVAIAKLALAGKRRPHDWPLLVRALTVVDSQEAAILIPALLRYRERGTNPVVYRNLMLVSLKLEGDSLASAMQLLSWWVRKQPEGITDSSTAHEKLVAWQKWFTKEYPHLPPPHLPQDAPTSPHRYQALSDFVYKHTGDAAKGAVIFEKAQCVKCHRVRDKGEKIGPELTKVVQRLTRREIVESVLFPSHQIVDPYSTRLVELKNGKILSGLVGESAEGYTILQSNAEKIVIARTDVESMHASPLSAMPTGLLDPYKSEDMADLIAFLHAAAQD